MRRWAVIAAVAMSVGCSAQSDIAGSYINSDDNGAAMVQLTSMTDGKVAGTLSVLSVKPDGKIDAVSRPLNGTIENGAVNLTVENGTGISLVTGKVAGDKLFLTFFFHGNSERRMFTKGEASKFDELADKLRVKAASNLESVEVGAAQADRIKQRSKTQGEIDRLADEALSLTEEASSKITKFNQVIAAYKVAAGRRQRMIAAKQSANEFDAGQIEFQMTGLDSDMKNIHQSVIDYRNKLGNARGRLGTQAMPYRIECQSDQLLSCQRLGDALIAFGKVANDFNKAFQREEAAFKAIGVKS